MKIIEVVHTFPPQIGGIERHAYELCKNLQELGEDVVVHTTGAPGKNEPFKVVRHFGIRFPGFSSVIFVPFLWIKLAAQSGDIYASHGYGSLMPFCTAIAAVATGRPFVFTVHGYPNLSGPGRIALWLYRNTLARFILAAATKVIVVSRESKLYLEGQVDKKKIVYVPNGVDTENFKCPPFTEGEYISYIGRLDKDKRVGMLINALAKTKKKEKLLVAGNDEGARPGLIKLAKNLHLDAEFTQVNPEEVPQLYCYSKAIVLPSRYEGFSLVWLEAMSAGRPIFSTPVGQAPELFREIYGADSEKFLFADEAGLVERLNYFEEHPDEFLELAKSAREKVEKDYSWRATAEKTLIVYEEALEKGKKK